MGGQLGESTKHTLFIFLPNPEGGSRSNTAQTRKQSHPSLPAELVKGARPNGPNIITIIRRPLRGHQAAKKGY